jgi:hypothetical protein
MNMFEIETETGEDMTVLSIVDKDSLYYHRVSIYKDCQEASIFSIAS